MTLSRRLSPLATDEGVALPLSALAGGTSVLVGDILSSLITSG